MISYRKLAMRVLGHSPVSAVKTARRSTGKRAAALALTAALVVGMTLPAFAQDWFIENGDIKISAGTNGNNVTQGSTTKENDTDTVIKSNGSSSNTVTIHADEGKTVDVTLENVNINTSRAAVSVTGKGDTNIELNGNNTLTSGSGHAGLEHNKTDTSGELTIQDNNKDSGSLKATGGQFGAGIGGAGVNDAQVKITGGKITATGGEYGAGIGGGFKGSGDVTISGGEIHANGGYYRAGIGGGDYSSGKVTISDGEINATGGYLGAGIGGGEKGSGDVTITGGEITASGGSYGAGIGGGKGVYLASDKKIHGGDGKVTITGGKITATSKSFGAGIGGGYQGLGKVTIEGDAVIKNAQGGAGAAGIGGGAESEPDDEGNGNKISIKSTEAGSPDITATGGGACKNSHVSLLGAAAIGSGSVNKSSDQAKKAKSAITIEGKVTINATSGGDVAIGDNIDGEKVFNGLAGGTTINRTDSNGKDVTQDGDVVAEPEPEKPEPEKPKPEKPEPEKPEPEKPEPEKPKPEPEKPKPEEPEQPAEPEKPAQPTVTPTEGAEAPSTGSVEVERPVTVEGLYVTNVLGKQITHTCTQNGTTLTIRANGIVTSAHLTLGMVRTLKAQGVKTLVFTTLLSRSTTVSVDALLAAEPDAPDETAVVWTHTGPRAALTINGTDHSALLK